MTSDTGAIRLNHNIVCNHCQVRNLLHIFCFSDMYIRQFLGSAFLHAAITDTWVQFRPALVTPFQSSSTPIFRSELNVIPGVGGGCVLLLMRNFTLSGRISCYVATCKVPNIIQQEVLAVKIILAWSTVWTTNHRRQLNLLNLLSKRPVKQTNRLR